ncbi:MAG: EI24 domain-containing protein, partial [Ferruginibacter sp.]
MLKEIVTAVQAYYLTHRFIIKHRLWKWIFIPGLIYTILFCMGIYLFASSSSHAIDFMMLRSGAAEWIQKMENSWLSWFVIFLQIIIYLVLIMFYFSLFKYLFLIVGAPLFAYLSEKTASIMDGKDYPFSFSQLMKDILRGISIAFRNMFW